MTVRNGYVSSNYINEMGKSRFDIECPFCKTVVTVYAWSLAGSGKRCPKCRALHSHNGYSTQASAGKEKS